MRSETQKKSKTQKGSALLVSLMVMVGLSLLGLGFVAISETESAIAINQRNYSQTLTVSEAGARFAVEWFQDPDWAEEHGFLPWNHEAIKRERWVETDNPPDGTANNVGYYKRDLSQKLFDKPFRQRTSDRLLGTEQSPDVLIDRETLTEDNENFLDKINAFLFVNPQEDGEITEIRVYAPPIIGGTTWENPGNPDEKFYGLDGTRYGLATVSVTATKWYDRDEDDVIDADEITAQRNTKVVVAEWPFPGPQGPIQSNANISIGGNFGVHWGKMTSQETMEFSRPLIGLPWHSAWERMHFEHGYDSSYEWKQAMTLQVGRVVHPSQAAQVANPDLKEYAYVVTAGGTTGMTEPTWPTPTLNCTVYPNCHDLGAGSEIADGTVRYRFARYAAQWPNTDTDPVEAEDWMGEIYGKTYEDPWWEARARRELVNAPNALPQPYQYDIGDAVNDESVDPTGYSNWFQFQDVNSRPQNRKEVIFPKIDYNFWKEIALAGSGQQGVKYLRWVGGRDGDDFTDGSVTKKWAKWINTRTGAEAGFYFFDTRNQQNPQGPGAPGILTPEIALNRSDDGVFTAMGFIYINAENFRSTGIQGVDGNWHNFPGEPYRDVGMYRKTTDAEVAMGQTANDYYREADGTPKKVDANNGEWNYQDINANGVFDVYVQRRPVWHPRGEGGSFISQEWLPVPWYPGCTIPTDGAGGNCSEPHEPYFNLIYPTNAQSGGGPEPLPSGWEDPTRETINAKNTLGDGTPHSCTGTYVDIHKNCVTNGYDRDGALVDDLDPMMDGVFYTEGDFRDTTGNAVYFGSLLINGNVGRAGTAEVWFDEKLIKGEWPPKRFKFPRVYISAVETDQE